MKDDVCLPENTDELKNMKIHEFQNRGRQIGIQLILSVHGQTRFISGRLLADFRFEKLTKRGPPYVMATLVQGQINPNKRF